MSGSLCGTVFESGACLKGKRSDRGYVVMRSWLYLRGGAWGWRRETCPEGPGSAYPSQGRWAWAVTLPWKTPEIHGLAGSEGHRWQLFKHAHRENHYTSHTTELAILTENYNKTVITLISITDGL